jgi:flagellar assembly protein FliH
VNKQLPVDPSEQVAKAWELPYVEDTRRSNSSTVTNALNHRSDWKYEPPEVEVEMLPPTQKEIEAIREAAHAEGLSQGNKEGLQQGHEDGYKLGKEQGFEQGLEEGRSEGLAKGEVHINEKIQIWTDLVNNLHEPVSGVEKELEKELVLLAVSLAKAVIRCEVKNNSDIVFQALSEGLKVLPINEKNYQIHLNPEDIQLINQHFSESEIEKHNWSLIETPQLQRGGCEIVTDTNAVDVTVEKRVRDVLDKFLLEQGLSHIIPDDDD